MAGVWWTSQPDAAFPVEFALIGLDGSPQLDSYDTGNRVERTPDGQFSWRHQNFADLTQLQQELLSSWNEQKYPLLDAAVLAARGASAAPLNASGGTVTAATADPSAPVTHLTDAAAEASLREAQWQAAAGQQGDIPERQQPRLPPELLAAVPPGDSAVALGQELVVDLFGSVIAHHAGSEGLCGWEPSPCFPVSRGGLRTLANVRPVHVVTHRQREHEILNAIVQDSAGAASEADAGGPGAEGSDRGRAKAVAGRTPKSSEVRGSYLVTRSHGGEGEVRLQRLRGGPRVDQVAALWDFITRAVNAEPVLSGSGGGAQVSNRATDATGTGGVADSAGMSPAGTPEASVPEVATPSGTAAVAAAMLLDVLARNWAGLDRGQLERSLPFRQLSAGDFPAALLRTYLACTAAAGNPGATGGSPMSHAAGGGPSPSPPVGPVDTPVSAAGDQGERDTGQASDQRQMALAMARRAVARALGWPGTDRSSPPTPAQLVAPGDGIEPGPGRSSVDGQGGAGRKDGSGKKLAAAEGSKPARPAPTPEEIGRFAWVPKTRRPAPLSPRFPRPFRHPDHFFLWPSEPLPVPRWVLMDEQGRIYPPADGDEGAAEEDSNAAGGEGDGDANAGDAAGEGKDDLESGPEPGAEAGVEDMDEIGTTATDAGGAQGEDGDADRGEDSGGASAAGGFIDMLGQPGSVLPAAPAKDGPGGSGSGGFITAAEMRWRRRLRQKFFLPYMYGGKGRAGSKGHTDLAAGPAGWRDGSGGGDVEVDGWAHSVNGGGDGATTTGWVQGTGVGLSGEGSTPQEGVDERGGAESSADARHHSEGDTGDFAGGVSATPDSGLHETRVTEGSSVDGTGAAHTRTGTEAGGGDEVPQGALPTAPDGAPLKSREPPGGRPPGTRRESGGGARAPTTEASAPSATTAEPAGGTTGLSLPGLSRLPPDAAARLQEAFRSAAAAAAAAAAGGPSSRRTTHLSTVKLPGADAAAAAAAEARAAAKATAVSTAAAGAAAIGVSRDAAAAPGAPQMPGTPQREASTASDSGRRAAGSVGGASDGGASSSGGGPQAVQGQGAGLPGLKGLPPEEAAKLQEAFQQAAASGRRHYHLRTMPLQPAASATGPQTTAVAASSQPLPPHTPSSGLPGASAAGFTPGVGAATAPVHPAWQGADGATARAPAAMAPPAPMPGPMNHGSSSMVGHPAGYEPMPLPGQSFVMAPQPFPQHQPSTHLQGRYGVAYAAAGDRQQQDLHMQVRLPTAPRPSKVDQCFGLLGPAGHVLSARDEEERIGQYEYFMWQLHMQRQAVMRGNSSGGGAVWGSAL